MNQKIQKYIYILLAIAVYLIVFPFVVYTFDGVALYRIGFFQYYISNVLYKYTIVGVILLAGAMYYDFKQ